MIAGKLLIGLGDSILVPLIVAAAALAIPLQWIGKVLGVAWEACKFLLLVVLGLLAVCLAFPAKWALLFCAWLAQKVKR